ncbi:phosphatase PAP2 family protein [Paenibacillus sp. CN-4]|uniref:phosphatase PAP2 family protein n=1 Tax=Paenibacillus nanchangensis TaxID=3348343 RepID=UPI00397BCD13
MTHRTKPNSRSAWLSLLWLTAIPVLSIFYGILNRPAERVYSLMIDLDRLTPFVPAFGVSYVLWYLFIPAVLIALAFKNKAVYYQTLFALCGGLAVSYLVYALFQTTVLRPDLAAETGLFHQLVRWVYQHDQPFNCFPSIHVLTSYLMLREAGAFKRSISLVVAGMSVLIIASTLFIKQHVLADVAGGILVGELLFRSAGLFVPLIRRYGGRLLWKGEKRHVSAE